MQPEYTYVIRAPEMLIEDVADFSRDECKTEIIISTNDTFDDLDFLGTFLSYSVDGRTYELTPGFDNFWNMTDIGSIPINV